jgi:uncharacterized membrane protein
MAEEQGMNILNPIVVTVFIIVSIVVFVVVAIIVTMERVEEAKRDHERAARARIEAAALNFDLRAVRERYQRDTGLSDAEVDRVEKEFRRYFLLVALSPGVALGLPGGRIDDFWHTAITFTATYRAYCQEVAGRFIDHDPTRGDVPYVRTYESYRAMFGEAPDPQLWEPRVWTTRGTQMGTKSNKDKESGRGDKLLIVPYIIDIIITFFRLNSCVTMGTRTASPTHT